LLLVYSSCNGEEEILKGRGILFYARKDHCVGQEVYDGGRKDDARVLKIKK